MKQEIYNDLEKINRLAYLIIGDGHRLETASEINQWTRELAQVIQANASLIRKIANTAIETAAPF